MILRFSASTRAEVLLYNMRATRKNARNFQVPQDLGISHQTRKNSRPQVFNQNFQNRPSHHRFHHDFRLLKSASTRICRIKKPQSAIVKVSRSFRNLGIIKPIPGDTFSPSAKGQSKRPLYSIPAHHCRSLFHTQQ